ncbi:DMT family transporter [Sinomicrobium weinanense]|uniref:DMT family transporter n=1 Tax=Sinomicrobium weinanense TaxID=2842200 RepID=A0A926Q399_9FLAO|nr:DMT family transporter [Sinomicrobium weinanense]MBC9796689.1 DMT family transporter [Sinomicrobium weinanense]MBU3123036.1 DMT family transporter [Sinomicrobium weinanense]
MNQLTLSALAFLGGIFLAAQGSYNAHLGVLLKNPFLASVTAFFFSTIFALIVAAISLKQLPDRETIQHIPFYLWFIGGLFCVLGISLYYYTIPRLGISTMISLGLCGQLIFAVIAGHFGWLNLPTEPITLKKTIGVISMIAGILLINLK